MLDLALFAQVFVWLGVILVFLFTRQASVYHPLTAYLGFHGIVFVIRPLLVHYLGFDHELLYMGIEPTETNFIRCLVVSSLGLLVFAAASATCGWSRQGFGGEEQAPFTLEQRRAFLLLVIILAPVIAYSVKAAESDFAVEERGGTYMMVGASGYAVEAQLMAGPLVCAFLALTRFRWLACLLVIPYVGYRSYAGMSRWSFVLLFVALGLIYCWQRRLKWLPAWSVLFAIPVLMLFQAVGENRAYISQVLRGEEYRRPTANPGSGLLDKWRTKYDGPDFANFDFLTFVVAMVPERTETYTYGAQYLQLLTEPIPRKLWPGKPAGAPLVFFNLNNYGNFLGRTVTLVGDGWISGGWLGVVITMTAAGGLLGLGHRWFWKNSSNNMVALFYLVGLAMLPQWFRDGGISIAKFLFWNLCPLVLWVAATWLLGPRCVPGFSILLPRGVKLRFLQAELVKSEHGPSLQGRGTNS